MKRIISLLLTIILCAALLPSAAFAWYPDDIMVSPPSNTEGPGKNSCLDKSCTMNVASEHRSLIHIMRAPKKESKKLDEAAGAELPVSEWTDIVKLYSCDIALLGLRSDGTVLVDRDAVFEYTGDDFISYRDTPKESYTFIYKMESSVIDKAVEEITAWSDVKDIYCQKSMGGRGIPVAITNSGRVLVPEILYRYGELNCGPEWKDALDALASAKNIEQVFFSSACIFAVEKGGKINSYPTDIEEWQKYLDSPPELWGLEEEVDPDAKNVDPADVFCSNDYSCIVEYGGTFVGARSSDGRIVVAGPFADKLEKAVSSWKNIKALYTFSVMQDWMSGPIDIIVGVDKKGKVYAEYRDNYDYEEKFAKMVCKEICSWKNLETMITWACWDGGTAQFVGINNKGNARVYNGLVYEDESSDYNIKGFTSVKNVSDARVYSGRVFLITKDGNISVIGGDEYYYDVSVSCQKKLASFGEACNYYAIAKDGTIGYIEYSWSWRE